MEMTTFTNGNAVKIESAEILKGVRTFGWGTELYLESPVSQQVGGIEFFPIWGRGTWCHIPITNDFDSVGSFRWRLLSIMLSFYTINSRIRHIHVYDGAYRLAAFDGYGQAYGEGFGLRGDYRDKPYEETIKDRPKLFSGVGISFYVAVSAHDIDVRPDGDNPPSVTVTGAGIRLWRPNRISILDLVRLGPRWGNP